MSSGTFNFLASFIILFGLGLDRPFSRSQSVAEEISSRATNSVGVFRDPFGIRARSCQYLLFHVPKVAPVFA